MMVVRKKVLSMTKNAKHNYGNVTLQLATAGNARPETDSSYMLLSFKAVRKVIWQRWGQLLLKASRTTGSTYRCWPKSCPNPNNRRISKYVRASFFAIFSLSLIHFLLLGAGNVELNRGHEIYVWPVCRNVISRRVCSVLCYGCHECLHLKCARLRRAYRRFQMSRPDRDVKFITTAENTD